MEALLKLHSDTEHRKSLGWVFLLHGARLHDLSPGFESFGTETITEHIVETFCTGELHDFTRAQMVNVNF